MSAECISFKLESEWVTALDAAVAKAATTDSRHKYARQIVVDHLMSDGQSLLIQQIAELRDEIVTLRKDLATVTVALLTQAGRIEDHQRARRWATKILLSH